MSAMPTKADAAATEETVAPVRRTGLPPWLKTSGPPLLVLIIALLLWQAVTRIFDIPFFILPTPVQVVQAAIQNGPSLLDSVLTTFEAAMTGFALSGIAGILIAMLLSSSKLMEVSFYPYAIVLQTIPVIAIAPLIIIWIGAGFKAVVTISFIISLFPVISNTTVGLTSTDHNLRNLFTLYNANRFQTLFKLKIPYALPFLLAGLRISSGLAVIGAIVGEFIAGIGGGHGGLGYLITVAASRMEMAYLFAAALSSSILGILVFFAVNWVTVKTLHWHESTGKFEN